MKKLNDILRIVLLLLLALSTTCAMAQDDEDEEEPCATPRLKKVTKLMEQGKKLQKEGKSDQAITVYEDVIDMVPDYAEPYFLIGRIKVRRIERAEMPNEKMFREAIGYFERVVEICPDFDNQTYYFLGKLYYSIPDYKKSAEALKIYLAHPDQIKREDYLEETETLYEYASFYDKAYNSPVPFDPVRVEGVSTGADEYLAIISPDDELCFFTRRMMANSTSRTDIVQTKKQKEVFMRSEREAGGVFDNGNPMPSPFNRSQNEGGATITVDNRYLVYTKCMATATGYYNCDLYWSSYRNGEWSEPQSLGALVNTPDAWESQPSISVDGQLLYFTSDRNGGYGGYDLYCSKRKKDGSWGKPANLGPAINTAGNEKAPFIHSDSQTLYFSSDGLVGLGGYDIFFSQQKEGKWQKAKNLGYPINSEEDDVSFFVSTSGTKAYFSTNRFGNKNWDLYSFDLYKEAQPENMTVIKGNVVSDDGNPVPAKVELKDVSQGTVQTVEVDESTGKYATVANQKKDYLLTVKKEGFANQTKYIAKQETPVEKPSEKVDFEVQEISIGRAYNLNDIYFATNSYELTEPSKQVLNEFYAFLTENPTVKVELQGHTDNVGNDKINLTLSDNRAKSVYTYLIEQGVSADRLRYKGYGSTRPIADNKTEAGRAKNRRTVFVILER